MRSQQTGTPGDTARALASADDAYRIGNLKAAEQVCRDVLRARPSEVRALRLLAAVTAQTGREAESLGLFGRIADSGVEDPAVLLNWGNVLRQTGRIHEARARYERAIALRADFAEGHNARGAALLLLGHIAEARACFDRAIALQPTNADALGNRAAVLIELRRHADALADCDRALASRPGNPQAHYNRAICLRALNRPEAALASCDRAIALKPDHAGAWSLKAQTLILLGSFAEGWRLHEWRWKGRQKHLVRRFTQPQWTGDFPLTGRTLLIHAELGLGDTIELCRYVPKAEAAGAKVVLEVQRPVASYVATLRSNATVITAGQALPPFDCHCPMMSLPYAFRSEVETIPHDVPYLRVPERKAQEWQDRLGAKALPRIGLAWAASSGHDSGPDRSLPLDLLDSLFALPGEIHVLQKDIAAAETDRLAARANVAIHAPALRDFLDTAAVIEAMDCIVSVDTAVAHVAGALAKDVLIMLPFSADYRWLTGRTDTPWYPTATLVRQRLAGDWPGVVQTVAAELARRLPGR